MAKRVGHIVNIRVSADVRLQCQIRGLAEEDVRLVVSAAVDGGYSEGDGSGRYLCKGSTEPGKYLFAYYEKEDDGTIVVVEVYA